MIDRRGGGIARIVATYAVFLAFLCGITSAIYVAVDAESRTLVVRLAVASVVGIVLVRAVRSQREQAEAGPASDFERALQQPSLPVRIDPLFDRLHTEVKNSLRSRRYFESVLGPRVLTLGRRRGIDIETSVSGGPAALRRGRRGPDVSVLSALIGRLERRT